MPSATGQNWEKYKKEFADDEEPEKKITPLTDEYVHKTNVDTYPRRQTLMHGNQGYSSAEDLWCCTVCCRTEAAGKANKGEADQR